MRNQVDYSTHAYFRLSRLRAAAAVPDEADRVTAQLEQCLTWYDPRLDPDTTTNCGTVNGPGLLPAPLYTARMIEVYPLRFYFTVDDTARPFVMTVAWVEWVLGLTVP